jgi:hypothetical protein
LNCSTSCVRISAEARSPVLGHWWGQQWTHPTDPAMQPRHCNHLSILVPFFLPPPPPPTTQSLSRPGQNLDIAWHSTVTKIWQRLLLTYVWESVG